MEETKLKNLTICFPEVKIFYDYIFIGCMFVIYQEAVLVFNSIKSWRQQSAVDMLPSWDTYRFHNECELCIIGYQIK